MANRGCSYCGADVDERDVEYISPGGPRVWVCGSKECNAEMRGEMAQAYDEDIADAFADVDRAWGRR